MATVVVRGKKIVGPERTFAGDICIVDGKIASISEGKFDDSKWKNYKVFVNG